MNKTHSTLALVLDRSGSMASCLEAAISSTNTEKINALRASALRSLSEEEARIKNAPLEDIVREEDTKRRS